jgi:hypothetical protein
MSTAILTVAAEKEFFMFVSADLDAEDAEVLLALSFCWCGIHKQRLQHAHGIPCL